MWGVLVALLLILSLSVKAQDLTGVPGGTSKVAPQGPAPGAPEVAPPPAVPQGMIVRDIRIEGNQRVEAGTILSYMVIKPGDAYDPGRVDRSLKALYGTGLFADVTIHTEGDILVVHVVENPIINRLAFEGNSRLSDETLQNEIQSRPRVVYSRAKVERDVTRILELYRRSGRFAATVQPKVIELPENRVDLVFEINEGDVTLIERVNFVGNHAFSDDTLKNVIMTKETRWYRFFSTDDTYDPDRLSFDRELLRRYYLKNGYADFRVVSAVAELAPNRDRFFITFTVDEGKRYKFGKVSVESRLRDLKVDDLRKLVTTKEGDWYNAEEVEGVVDKMTDFAGRYGYAFVDIQPDVKRNAEASTIDLNYIVNEGRRVYVERIDVTGNTRTLDKVIRREMRLIEGDAFNTARLRLSQQKIRNLGFFEKVDVDNVPGSAPDRTVVKVNLDEKSTGELQIGAGYSTTEGVLGNFSVRERNFLGRGQDMNLTLLLSQRTQQIDLGFTEPYFLDKNISAGFDIFDINRNNRYLSQSQYNQDTLGFTLRSGYQVTESLRHTVHYTLRRTNITNIASTTSIFIRNQAGKTTTSEVGQTFLYDKRDDRFAPTNGYYLEVGNDYAGLGGDIDYMRVTGEAGYFYPFAAEWIGSVVGRGGWITGVNGQKVRIQDRFFLGQESLRGFALAGIGPRDAATRDALGGNKYYDVSFELGFPIGLPKAFGITGHTFLDAGTVTGIDDTASGGIILDKPSIRAAVGFGLSWRSPFGPVRVDLGYPVQKEPFDKTSIFRFNFGTKF